MKITGFDAVLEFPRGEFRGEYENLIVNGVVRDNPAEIEVGQFVTIKTACCSLSGWSSSVGVYPNGVTVVLEGAFYDGAFNGVCGRWGGVEWEETVIPPEAAVSSFLSIPTWGQYEKFRAALEEAASDAGRRGQHGIGPHGLVSFVEARQAAAAWLRSEEIELSPLG